MTGRDGGGGEGSAPRLGTGPASAPIQEAGPPSLMNTALDQANGGPCSRKNTPRGREIYFGL